MSRHLLVPVDDSGPAMGALEHALTAHGDAEVTVLHVRDDLEAGYAGEPGTTTEPDVFDDVRRIAADRDVPVEPIVREGTAAPTILATVRELDVDGIVMGSQGRAGVSRVLLGSVAEAVTRRSPVPVTIVPSERR